MWVRAQDEVEAIEELFDTYSNRYETAQAIEESLDILYQEDTGDLKDLSGGIQKKFQIGPNRAAYVKKVERGEFNSEFRIGEGPTEPTFPPIDWFSTESNAYSTLQVVKSRYFDDMQDNYHDLRDLSDIEPFERRKMIEDALENGLDDALEAIYDVIDTAQQYADAPQEIGPGELRETAIDIDLRGWQYVEDNQFAESESAEIIENSIAYINEAIRDISKIEWNNIGSRTRIDIPTYRQGHGFLTKEITVRQSKDYSSDDGDRMVVFEVEYAPIDGWSSIDELSSEHIIKDYDPDQPRKPMAYIYDEIEASLEKFQQIKQGVISVRPTEIRGPSTLDIKTGLSERGEHDGLYKGDAIVVRFEDAEMPFDSSSVEDKADRIDFIVKHEILHFGQYTLEDLFELDGLGGLPPKAVQTDPDKEVPPFMRQDHAKRDVEFYTRLNDEVDLFMEFVSDYDPQVWKPLAKAFMRQSVDGGLIDDRFSKWGDFEKDLEAAQDAGRASMGGVQNSFEVWKEEEPEKYKKAVKEFWKAIQDRMDS
jgi:hypothetical protein